MNDLIVPTGPPPQHGEKVASHPGELLSTSMLMRTRENHSNAKLHLHQKRRFSRFQPANTLRNLAKPGANILKHILRDEATT